MQAHKIIEMLRGLSSIGKIDPVLADVFEESIVSAVKFEFDCGVLPEYREGDFSTKAKGLKLPYPLCYFEFAISTEQTGALLAQHVDEDDSFIGFMPFFKDGKKWSMLSPDFRFAIDTNIPGITVMNNDPEVQSIFSDMAATEDQVGYINYLPSLLLLGLDVMKCSNVVCKDNEAPAALNKKRLKKDKIPFFSYKTLHIIIDKPRAVGSGHINSTESGHTKRLHLRRGHIRRLSQERSIWVSSCMVGDAAKGIVSKDYLVSRGDK